MKFVASICIIVLLRITWGNTIYSETKSCTEVGTICSQDCKAVEFCGTIGEGPVQIFECPSEIFCSVTTGSAACNSKIRCGEPTQACTTSGGIPSPFNCSQYYLCAKVGSQPELITCEEDTFFDTVLKKCSGTIPCRDPIDCTSDGQNGFVDPVEKQFKYICDPSGLPIVFPNVDMNGNTTTTPPMDSTSTGSTTKAPETTRSSTQTPGDSTTKAPTTPDPVICKGPGDRVPVEGDCHSFYQCNSEGDTSPTLKTCLNGFYYDINVFACVRGNCDNALHWSW